MLKLIETLPGPVLAVEAAGKVTADDYRTVLVPAAEKLIAEHPRIRLLYVLGRDFDGFSGGAAWEDAKLGLGHFTAFERVAVVTDVDWVKTMVKAFGFAMPGEVATFGLDELDAAREWIAAPRPPGKLEFELDEQAGVLVLRPHDELEVSDFERVAAAVDPWLDKAGSLSGVMIVADEFPGWDSFAAMLSHFRFVRDHVRKVRRVALVSSSRFLSALPRLAQRFVDADVRQFESADVEAARSWVRGAAGPVTGPR
jgi:SpoIIAA-like